MSDVVLQINATFGKSAAERETGDLEAKVKASMRAVRRENWMATDEDSLFRAGVAGALLAVGSESEDGVRLTQSIEALRKVAAFLNASQAGLDVEFPDFSANDTTLLPLMKWWHETAEAPR